MRLRRKKTATGPSFYVVRELGAEERYSSIRINLWNGLATSVDKRKFFIVSGSNLNAMGTRNIVEASQKGFDVELHQEPFLGNDWMVRSSSILPWLETTCYALGDRTLVAILPRGLFLQVGLCYSRQVVFNDIMNSLLLEVFPKSKSYIGWQKIHQPIHEVSDYDLLATGVRQ